MNKTVKGLLEKEADLGCTKEEAETIIEHVALNVAFGMSKHPVTERF